MGSDKCARCGGMKSDDTRRHCAFCVLAWLVARLRGRVKCGVFFALIVANLATNLHAEPVRIGEVLAVRTILGEAEGEPQKGRQAVGEVLRRRGSVRGFYGAKAVRFDGANYWRGARRIDSVTVGQALKAWRESERSNIAQGATHFENVKAFGVPYWASAMIPTVRIGAHQFYKEVSNG